MIFDKFLTKNVEFVRKDGLDSEYFETIKNLFQINPKFFENVQSEDQLELFYNLINDGDINIHNKNVSSGDSDYLPMTRKSYWTRGDKESFTYTSRILPEIHKDYSKLYKTIFDGRTVLPSGLDPQSKQNPDAKTIWNLVAQAETGGLKTGQKEGGGSSGKFLDKSDAERETIVHNKLKSIDKDVANKLGEHSPELKAVTELVARLIAGK